MIAHHSLDWWLRHVMGIDSQQTAFYMFWSGPGPCLIGVLTVVLGWYAIRLELRALKLETQLLQRELESHREEVEGGQRTTPLARVRERARTSSARP